MKMFKKCLTLFAILLVNQASAQFTLLPGTGINSYFGDLKENVAPFNQVGLNASMGLDLKLSTLPRPFDRFHVQGNVQYIKLNAEDKNNDREDLKQRNLSFGTSVFSAQLGFSYDIFGKNAVVNAYPVMGTGLIYFDPYTYENNNKVFLRDLKTEGQAEKYSRTAMVNWIGFGTKANVEGISIGLEFRYWKTNTDYLDDVSNWGYPNPATLSAATLPFTWRGNGPYPSGNGGTYLREGNGLNRGNPGKNDGFTTFQLRIGVPLNAAKAAGLLSKDYNTNNNNSEVEKQCEKDRNRYKQNIDANEKLLREWESEYTVSKLSEDCNYKEDQIIDLNTSIESIEDDINLISTASDNQLASLKQIIMLKTKGDAKLDKLTGSELRSAMKVNLEASKKEKQDEITRLKSVKCDQVIKSINSTIDIQKRIDSLKAAEEETFKMWEALKAICPEKTAQQKCRENLEAAIKERNDLEEELKDLKYYNVEISIQDGASGIAYNTMSYCPSAMIGNQVDALKASNPNISNTEITDKLLTDTELAYQLRNTDLMNKTSMSELLKNLDKEKANPNKSSITACKNAYEDLKNSQKNIDRIIKKWPNFSKLNFGKIPFRISDLEDQIRDLNKKIAQLQQQCK